MNDYGKSEIAAGAFVILGLAAVGYLSISIGGLRLGRRDEYSLRARFSNVGALKPRAPVKVAGVTIGRVESIGLADYMGEVQLVLERRVVLPADTIASVTTSGLLGDAFVALSPGSADGNLGDGDVIRRTEPALNMADLIGRAAFGDKGAGGEGVRKDEAP